MPGGTLNVGRNPPRRSAPPQPRDGHRRGAPGQPAVAHRDRIRDRPQPLHHLRDLGRPDSGRHTRRDEGRASSDRAKRGRPQVALALNPKAGDRDRRRAVAQRSFRRRSSTMPAGSSPRRTGGCRPRRYRATNSSRNCVAMLRRLTAGRSAGQLKPLRIVLAIQGITDAARPRHALVADHAAPRHSVRRHTGARIRHTDDRRERLQHDGGRVALARSRPATATISSPSCSRTASAWGWC